MIEAIRSVYVLMYHKIISVMGADEKPEQWGGGIKRIIKENASEDDLAGLLRHRVERQTFKDMKTKENKTKGNQHNQSTIRPIELKRNVDKYKHLSNGEEELQNVGRSICAMVRAGPKTDNKLIKGGVLC
ncbi:MAG: hypothetical protein FH758_14730 [Firmicutes bacterium]|nr:hypothetical protein [Bacillota bacterium]